MCVQNKMQQTKTQSDATLCFDLLQHDNLHMRAARHSLVSRDRDTGAVVVGDNGIF